MALEKGVAICMITFQRPEGLARTLRALNELSFKENTAAVRIVVVDNDPASSARSVCENLCGEFRWPIDYCMEAQRGIAHARNRALRRAAPNADWIAFVDDDEAPEAGWLDELMRIQRAYNADVVTGPVRPRFVEPPPQWIVRGRFFESRRYPTGQRLDRAFTHNVLFGTHILQNMEPFFDSHYALMGGSDSHFFQRVCRAGYKIVWADDAIVHEWIPVSRARLGWLLRRSYRTGNTLGIIAIDFQPSWLTRLMIVAKAAAWMAIGLFLVPCGLVTGYHAFVKGLRYIAYGLGLLLSVGGVTYEEYKNIHGT